MTKPLRVLVAGLGHMGLAHAMAYDRIDGFELAGLCYLPEATPKDLPARWSALPHITDFGVALAQVKPDVVSINTWSNTHADYAIRAFDAGAHVFLEKPMAETVADAERVAAAAKAAKRKLVVGYILRHHPSWLKLVELARGLGKPLVFRMNLNQQSFGPTWVWHRTLMRNLSPIVEAGVHYVDLMALIAGAKPKRVHAVGARLTEEIPAGMYNYGHLQVTFADGSIGWFEAGFGPMMSEVAYFVKDIVGPKGSVSFVAGEQAAGAAEGAAVTASASSDTYVKTNTIRLHHAELRADGGLARADEVVRMTDEPDHDALCEREQRFLLEAIRTDADLSGHWRESITSLAIALAADRSIREGRIIEME